MKNTIKKALAVFLSFLIFIVIMCAIELAIYPPIYSRFVSGKLDIYAFPYIKMGLSVWHLLILWLVAPKVTDKISAFIERKLGIDDKAGAEQANGLTEDSVGDTKDN